MHKDEQALEVLRRRTGTMSQTNVQQLCQSTREQLKTAASYLEQFLNNYNLVQLVEDDEERTLMFYQAFLSDLRHLSVYCEDSYEQLGIVLRRGTFEKSHGEKVLYRVYHDCVNHFFYPKNESYSEDGRYAYTGRDAIKFRKRPNRAAHDIVVEITNIFETLRDDLEYYESEYLSKVRLERIREEEQGQL